MCNMDMCSNKCVIIIPTNSKYLDICSIFLNLLRNNWDCPFPIILSVTGDNTDLNLDVDRILYNGHRALLTECVYNAVKEFDSNSYLVFLGDAFFCNAVDLEHVKFVINSLEKNKIDYCSFLPKKTLKKKKYINKDIRLINFGDRYCHTFVAFYASKEFCIEEFSNSQKSDLDFELKYLNESKQTEIHYKTHAILTDNLFHIKPGITKGKWDRNVYKYIKKNYPDISLSNREKLSRHEQLIISLRGIFSIFIPAWLRIKLKKIFSKYSNSKIFITDN